MKSVVEEGKCRMRGLVASWAIEDLSRLRRSQRRGGLLGRGVGKKAGTVIVTGAVTACLTAGPPPSR